MQAANSKAGLLTHLDPPDFGKSSSNQSTSSEMESNSESNFPDQKHSVIPTHPFKKRLKLLAFSSYTLLGIIGTGAFGVVYKAHPKNNPFVFVAIKRVASDGHYSDRELDILTSLNHPNCVRLHTHFIEKGSGSSSGQFMNFVMDFFPFSLDKIITQFTQHNVYKINIIRNYSWQLCQALEYLHSKSICHRDIKPQNVLIDFATQKLALGDFGSAKTINSDKNKSVAYVCSRHYRAPELIMGEEEYGLETDIWSLGCVFAEMIIGKPLFNGSNSKDQFVKIMKVLGTPSSSDLIAMCPNIQAHLPIVEGEGLRKSMGDFDELFVDLISQMLVYDPSKRLKPGNAKRHSFFGVLKKIGGTKKEGSHENELLMELRCD